MLKLSSRVCVVTLGVALLAFGPQSMAQPRTGDAEAQKKQIVRSVMEKMPDARRRVLSGAAQNLARWAAPQDEGDREGPGERGAGGAPLASRGVASLAKAKDRHVPVNDPSTDFTRSVLIGFTQSETSTAWCGENVVIGFNDSGSILETQSLGRGVSGAGVARSTDHGRSFTDLGFLNPGPDPGAFLAGDPVVGCASATRFHYASIFQVFSEVDFSGRSAISVSTSTDGGATWGDPMLAVSKDIFEHFLDKDWMAVDPSNANKLYVTYTDFAGFDLTPDCPFDFATNIELVRSIDGGLTWSSPVVVDSVCSGNGTVQGSQVVVGPAGEVNVAWERFPDFFQVRQQAFRRSTDGGQIFSPTVIVSDVTCTGDCLLYQGGFRSAEEFPSLAVDRSDGKTRGNLYLAWNDGRNKQVPDEGAVLGVYGYADILVSRSTDGGFTWSAPVTANHDRSSRDTDQYMPGIAVDRGGRVGVCYYDRSLDRDNFKITRSCSTSKDAGFSWRLLRITNDEDSFEPFHGNDLFINPVYMGDYDALASDTLEERSGFLGGFLDERFQGNQNVLANSVRFN